MVKPAYNIFPSSFLTTTHFPTPQFISSLPKLREVLQFIPPTEQDLSTLLGGCRVTALEGPASTMTAHGHYGALLQLVQTMEKHNALGLRKGRGVKECCVLSDNSLEGVKVIIEG